MRPGPYRLRAVGPRVGVLLLGHSQEQEPQERGAARETAASEAGGVEADLRGGRAWAGGGKRIGTRAEVGAHPRAPLRTPPFRRPGRHVARPTEPDPVGHHLRPPEPTIPTRRLLGGGTAPQLRDPDTFKSPALSPLAELHPDPLSLATVLVT